MGKNQIFKNSSNGQNTVRKRSHKLWQAVCLKEKPAFPCVKTIASKMKKINSTREVGFHLCLKLKKRCIVGKKRATEVS